MKHLLSPVSIGNCTLQNRIVLTAASLCRSPNGMVTPELIDFYAARAKGGVGLLMVGAAGVDPFAAVMEQFCKPVRIRIFRNCKK